MAEQSYGDWIRSNPPMPTKNLNTKHMAQTAVEFLIPILIENIQSLSIKKRHEIVSLINQAKEMDKQQHGQTWDAAIKAHDDRGGVHARSIVDFDEWYNETFKK
jgi:hypothetical protein